MQNMYFRYVISGGATGSLDGIDGALLADGDICIVAPSSIAVYFYRLNASSGASESSPDIISPDANAGTKRWILTNIVTDQLFTIGASVGSNALTLSLQPCAIDFRSATLTSGAVLKRVVSSAISLVVPNGATLGTANAVSSRLVVIAIDNAGTVELAVCNISGGVNFDETTLLTTTTISTSADLSTVAYSTTGRTSVAHRVVGFIDITEATAGAWATAATKIQGCGGEAITGMSSVGYGMIYHELHASRAMNTNYVNTTGRPMFVNISAHGTQLAGLYLDVDGVHAGMGVCHANGEYANVGGVVPPGATYAATNTAGTFTLDIWSELY
jgi:hypothetical protein